MATNRMSISEAAERFGVSRRTLERWIQAGRLSAIPSAEDARRRLVDPEMAQSLVEQMPKRPRERNMSAACGKPTLTDEDQKELESKATARRYRQAIDDILQRVYSQHQRLITQLHPEAFDELTLEDLRDGPLGRDLQRLAVYADGQVYEPNNLVLAAIESTLQALFWPAAAEEPTVPRVFWDTDLGKMINRAKLRAHRPQDLVSIDDAARMFGVTTPTIYRWMDDRTLGWVRDDRNGRTWVVRRDVEQLKRVATELAARHTLLERALAS